MNNSTQQYLHNSMERLLLEVRAMLTDLELRSNHYEFGLLSHERVNMCRLLDIETISLEVIRELEK